ncbi:MAG: acetyl-CoA carboxylase biotin carboxyl carrier protein [bacterium]|nr:acetyl-CoA carboxylase biotin carboxyl carrier protein [bacterium]
MDIQNILTLIQAVSDSTLTAFDLEEGNLKLSLKRGNVGNMGSMENAETVGQTPWNGTENDLSGVILGAVNGQAMQGNAGTAKDAAAAVDGKVHADGNLANKSVQTGEIASDKVVFSPLVGTFYASSSPEAESFVKVGDTVKKGQVLGIIEAMKLMNEIESDYDGVVEAILVKNEDVVEYGQPLFRIH